MTNLWPFVIGHFDRRNWQNNSTCEKHHNRYVCTGSQKFPQKIKLDSPFFNNDDHIKQTNN